MNVLLVGLGRWGEKHLRVLAELGATVWVADVVPERLAWAIRHGVAPSQAVAEYRSVLGAVDAVDVVTPAESHWSIARSCLAAGRIGAVRYATGRFSGFKRPRVDVGVTQTDAIHYFDLFAYLFDREATRVNALQRDFLGRGLDDLSVTVVHYGAVPAVVEANYFVPGTWRECVIVGEHGTLVADYGASCVTLHLGEHRRHGAAWEAVETGKEELPTGRDEPLRLELEAFLHACAGRAANPVPAAAGVRALEIVEAAERSARLGGDVALPLES